MTADDPVMAINRKDRLAVLDDGQICMWTNMLDADGDETDRADEAVYAICQLPSGKWALIYLEAFGREGVN